MVPGKSKNKTDLNKKPRLSVPSTAEIKVKSKKNIYGTEIYKIRLKKIHSQIAP